MRVGKLLHSFSFLIGVALAALTALQLPPVPGVILMMFGAAYLAGLLAQAFLVSLFVEAAVGRIPRAFAVIPIVAYGAYYVAYFQESWQLQVAQRASQTETPEVALRFDPATQSLVVSGAAAFVSRYDVPVAYEADPKVKLEGYEAYRLLPADQCAIAHASYAMPGLSRLLPRDPRNISNDHACVYATPERPPLPRITVVNRIAGDDIWRRKPGIVETGVYVERDGKPVASYRTGAYAWRLTPFPQPYIGCFLDDAAPAWRCAAGFARSLTKVGRVDATKGDASVFAAVAGMLGIREVPTIDGLLAPRPVAGLDALLQKLPKLQSPQPAEQRSNFGERPGDDDLFAAFAGFLTSDAYPTIKWQDETLLVVDGSDSPSPELKDAVLRDPARLVALRDPMIAKLSAMHAHGVSRVSDWVRMVERALTIMPKAAFIAIPDDSLASLLQYLRDSNGRKRGGLYVRAADAGKRALSFYSYDLTAHGPGWSGSDYPDLAICRIGEIDDASRQGLRVGYLDFLPRPRDNGRLHAPLEFGAALFLSLLATGDEQFLRDHPFSGIDEFDRQWFELQLDGKGRVDGRPNNCQVIDSENQQDDPRGPGLTGNGYQWTETAAASGH
jgi:hypothetical protein